MMTAPLKRGGRWQALLLAAALTVFAGCTGDMRDLNDYATEVKSRPGGRIEPLPQIQPYEGHAYSADQLRSPFVPDDVLTRAGRPTVADGGISPDPNRNREFLEDFPLDSLRMVGTIELENRLFGLIAASDGLIHRVQAGNHMGQNHGKIVAVDDSEIRLVEIISDGLGGWIERPAAVALGSE